MSASTFCVSLLGEEGKRQMKQQYAPQVLGAQHSKAPTFSKHRQQTLPESTEGQANSRETGQQVYSLGTLLSKIYCANTASHTRFCNARGEHSRCRSACFRSSPMKMTVDDVPSPQISSWAVAVRAIRAAVGFWICISWRSVLPSLVSFTSPEPDTSIFRVPFGPTARGESVD